MTTSKELFPGIFSRHAAAYKARHDLIRSRGESRGRSRLLELLQVRPGQRVLDLCCGPGNLAAEILDAEPSARVTGVDLAPGMLALASAELGAGFVLGDAEALPFTGEAFDAVICGHGLQFCADLVAALGETRRVLRAGGCLAASVPHGSGGRGSRVLDRALDQCLPPFPRATDREATMRVVDDPGAFAAAARRAGYAEAHVEEIEGEVRWAGPREMVEQALGWWAGAVRLEGLPEPERQTALERALAVVESELGDGPIEIPSSDLVLFARA